MSQRRQLRRHMCTPSHPVSCLILHFFFFGSLPEARERSFVFQGYRDPFVSIVLDAASHLQYALLDGLAIALDVSNESQPYTDHLDHVPSLHVLLDRDALAGIGFLLVLLLLVLSGVVEFPRPEWAREAFETRRGEEFLQNVLVSREDSAHGAFARLDESPETILRSLLQQYVQVPILLRRRLVARLHRIRIVDDELVHLLDRVEPIYLGEAVETSLVLAGAQLNQEQVVLARRRARLVL